MVTSIARSFLISMLIPIAMILLISGSAQAIPSPVAINFSPDPLGSNWKQTSTGGFLPTFELVPTAEHRIAIWFDDNSVSVFDVSFEPSSSLLIPIQFLTAVVYTPRPGTTGTLVSSAQPFFYSGGAPGPGVILDFDFNVFNPNFFVFTTANNDQIRFDRRTLPTREFNIPEPGAFSIVAIGLIGLGVARRRRAAER